MSRCSVTFLFLCAPLLFASDCIPGQEAGQHIGESKCVAGKVLSVKVGAKGVHFLDFREDQMHTCAPQEVAKTKATPSTTAT
jgi:hypothetical protein